jgi:hypothetical protein
MDLVEEIAIDNVLMTVIDNAQIIATVAVLEHVQAAAMEVANLHVNTPAQIVVKTISNSDY